MASPPPVARPAHPQPLPAPAPKPITPPAAPAPEPVSTHPEPPAPRATWLARCPPLLTSKFLTAAVEQLSLVSERDGTATLLGSREIVQAATTRRAELEAALSKLAQRPVRVEFTIAESPAAPPASDPSQPARRPMQEHPLVRAAIEELGAVFVREAPRSRPPSQ